MQAKQGMLLAAIALLIGGPAEGSLTTFATSAGATMDGQPIDARATFTTSDDHVTVVLENVWADPKNVAQNVRGIFFTLSSGQTAGTLVASLGTPRTVARQDEFTDAAATDTGWVLTTAGSQMNLTALGGAAWPARTIIGPPDSSNHYSNANGSIAGNGPHNPFLAPSATFELDVPGVTASSGVSAVTFSFNTTLGDDSPGVMVQTVPEPAVLVLLGLGIPGFAFRRPVLKKPRMNTD